MRLRDAIEHLSDIEVGTMDVDTIKLKKSTLTPKGAIYETLKEVHL
jgi:2'-5' RNA ligase